MTKPLNIPDPPAAVADDPHLAESAGSQPVKYWRLQFFALATAIDEQREMLVRIEAKLDALIGIKGGP